MERLPFEVRVQIYKNLDLQSVLKMRVVKSTFMNEINSSIPVRIRLNTNGLSNEALTKLCTRKLYSVNFHAFYLHAEDTKTAFQSFGKEYVFGFPQFVESLEFGLPGMHFQNGGLVNEAVIFKSMEECCDNLKSLTFNHVELYGPAMSGENHQKLPTIVTRMQKLKHLDLNFKPTSARAVRALPTISSLLEHCTSPDLTSISLTISIASQNGFTYERILPNPWTRAFKLIARHWETLTALSLEISEDPYVGIEEFNRTEPEAVENLKKLDKLTYLRLTDDKFHQVDVRTDVRSEVSTLISQQTSLEEFIGDAHYLSYGVIMHIAFNNWKTIKSIQVTNIVGEARREQTIFSFSYLSNCIQLENLTISGAPSNQGQGGDRSYYLLTNLYMLPPYIQRLSIVGLRFHHLSSQLHMTAQRCLELKYLELGLECQSLSGLKSALKQCIRSCLLLREINLKVKRLFPSWKGNKNGGAGAGSGGLPIIKGIGWEGELPLLASFFSKVQEGEIQYTLETEGGSTHTADEFKKSGAPVNTIKFEYYSFSAINITEEDRIRILTPNTSAFNQH